MIRVGFIFSFDDSWIGGVNYFRNLLTALYAFPERELEAVIFTGFRSEDRHFEGFPSVKIVRSSLFDQSSLSWWVRRIIRRTFSRDVLVERLLKKHSIDALSHSGWLGKRSSIPTIGWIADFQHVRLPKFFSPQEIAKRNAYYHSLCRYCTKVVVSSYDAQSDLHRFAFEYSQKSEVLQFAVAVPDLTASLASIDSIEDRYEFSGKYFLLPNQFWVHKNHGLVIEALGLLIRDNKKVLVLCTGATDYRNPVYFGELMARVRELQVQDCFRVLGLVPAGDLAVLMRHAIALINPSRFEGWSTIVEEAKSLGTTILLSDIPVHREQDPPFAKYFSTDDANALAAEIMDAWNVHESIDIQSEELSRLVNDERRLEFARNYQRIIFRAVARVDVDEQKAN